MKPEKIFTEGMIFKLPNEKAPDFIKGSLSFKVTEFIDFLKKHDNKGWVNIDLKVSTGGKAYAEINTWKPKDVGEVKAEELPTDLDFG